VQVQKLGHVVLQVRDRERAERFYSGVLGLPIVARYESVMTFFSLGLGNHHDFAVREVGRDAPRAPEGSPGLAHVAFKVGESLDELRAAKLHLEAAGVTIDHVTDHTVSQGLYLQDPDGNWIELYVDTSNAWKHDPQAVATIRPMTL
jgi:catechol 2,3-dioxygenase